MVEMNNSPLVAIGVPNYNYAHYVVETLNSVANQTYPNIELIIVDDFSTDNSVEVIDHWINSYRGNITINFIKNKVNLGLTKVCNIILENAKGKYFQTLDADDLLLPGKIETQVGLLESSQNTAVIYSNIGVIDEHGNVIKDDYLGQVGYDKNNMPKGKIFEKLFEFNFIPLPSVLINTDYAKKAGGFDETLHVKDYYLWLKLAEKHQIIYQPENTAFYRQHESSMSNSFLTSPRSEESILRIKLKYYKNGNDNIKKIFRKNLYFSAAYLYQHKYPSAKRWLKQNFVLNPGIKNFSYYIAIRLGISYSFFEKMKKLNSKSSNG
jgi:glycosyltransferase involved in cell wall biosynthesis